MTPTRYAFIKASWHADIVDHALARISHPLFLSKIGKGYEECASVCP
ncbi:hypothetical protein [Rhizobium leguminosarum]|nr:hypothetical protein [Rhizobium leguminosarum]